MRTIGFKNFRRFENLKPLELSGITFFVGGNNAGKSTVVKAMMLMLDNMRNEVVNDANLKSFRFGSDDSREIHVGTFGRALHKPYPEKQEIEFCSTLDDIDIRYVIKGDVEDKQRLNADVHIYELSNKKGHWIITFDFVENKVTFKYPESLIKSFDPTPITYDIQSIARRMRAVETKSIAPSSRQSEELEKMIAHLQAEIDKLEDSLTSLDEIRRAVVFNEINEKQNKLKTLQSRWNQIQSSINTDIIITEELPFSSEDYQENHILLSIIRKIYERKTEEAQALLAKTTSPNKRAVCERIISDCNKKREWFGQMYRSFGVMIYQQKIYYIPSHSVVQRVFFSREDKNDYMSSVISEYQSKHFVEDGEQERFIKTWMTRFKVGTNFKINAIEGEAFTVSITNMDGQDVALADMGMGSIQIFLLLLKLASLKDRSNTGSPLIIIEEPEQNLHPGVQSKLAELFLELHDSEDHFRFVIETHSEYMIRKTQAMIATGKSEYGIVVDYENNPFRVYYFPEKENVPYNMGYKESGMFEEKFGEGFFDEASRQQFEVMKRARTSR